MKEKELLEKEALEKLFQAQKKFQKEKRIYDDATYQYYKTLDYIQANYPDSNPSLDKYIQELLKANNMDDFEIKEYNDSKIFDYIVSNIDSFLKISDFIKNSFLQIKPDNINKLSVLLAARESDYLFKTILENHKNPNNINQIIKPIVQDTYNVAVFEEQVREVVKLILDTNEFEIDMFLKSLNRLWKIKRNSRVDDSIFIIDFIRQNQTELYIEQYKTPYFGFINSCIEKGITEDEAKKLFNSLAVNFRDCVRFYRNEKILEAKQLYKIAFIEMNYPNKSENNNLPNGVIINKRKVNENGN